MAAGVNAFRNGKELESYKLVQLELFGFAADSDEPGSPSHTVGLYDAVPKFFLYDSSKYGLQAERKFVYKGKVYHAKFSPALIEKTGKQVRPFYPGQREELIEDDKRKI